MRRTRVEGRRRVVPIMLLCGFLLTASLASGQEDGTDPPPGATSHRCEVQPTLVQQGKTWGIRVEASTNLPKGTELLVNLVYCEEVVESSWARVFVNGPRFSKDLGPFEQIPFAGTYTVRLSCDLARQDPGPYTALQDEGDLEFLAPVYVGARADELAQDKAFLEWVNKSVAGLTEQMDELRATFRRAAEKKEFRTEDGAFDAFGCTRWVDRWIARAQGMSAGADAFRKGAFAPKYPAWIRKVSEAATASVAHACARATQCFQANGVPPPPKYNMGGGIIVETVEGMPILEVQELQKVASQLAAKIKEEEKDLNEKPEKK